MQWLESGRFRASRDLRTTLHWLINSRIESTETWEEVWGLASHYLGFPGDASGKEPPCQCRRYKRHGFHPRVRKIPWRRKWQPTPMESHAQRSRQGTDHRVAKSWTQMKATLHAQVIHRLSGHPGGRTQDFQLPKNPSATQLLPPCSRTFCQSCSFLTAV